MRTFAIGDIHGGLKALIELLNTLKLKEEDNLIFMGDYVDGWSESAQVIQFLIELSNTFNCVFIKGNHDVWAEEWLRNGDVNPTWYMHGGKETMESYEGFSDEEKRKHLEFFKNLSMYHLDADNRLFLHAGFTSMHGVEKEVFQTTLYFDRTLWEMALTMDKRIEKNSELYPKRLKHYKEIYIGHTPTINYKRYEPMNAINVWNIDTGAAFFGKLSAINIDTKEVFQSGVVKDLYPNEKGRNKN
ncbi:metallophosphoesterase family protein [Hyunsoonleella pacifica]|uniref:Serine/threonine protein phosphatase n=1 Tax=Hyunsoonleella pacifica TaxID=1080224 RepID=A0A4V2JAX9_9FLAO|nr:metallophosphoesterase family protein [Hyunsoonleella pacifica]TBN15585.1 serine/threonine protein phosphatase [Hyunsoonleella pacifica]GGD21086.1 metallophosphatase [Hyunsoonleella pacifica]